MLLADTSRRSRASCDVFIGVYILLILAFIIMSWVRLPYSLWLNRIQRFLYDVCDPYLRLFRRFVPPLGPLDLSPMVGRDRALRPRNRSSTRSSTSALTGEVPTMALTPVEIRHIKLGRSLFGYNRAARRRAARRHRRQLRAGLARARRPRRQGRAPRGGPRPLPRARDAAPHDARLGRARVAGAEGAGAPRGGLVMLEEAHAEARQIRRDALARSRAHAHRGSPDPLAARRRARDAAKATNGEDEAETLRRGQSRVGLS